MNVLQLSDLDDNLEMVLDLSPEPENSCKPTGTSLLEEQEEELRSRRNLH